MLDVWGDSLTVITMSTIQVRVDTQVKRSANRVLGALGLDMSTAVKLFLRQVAHRQGIPFLLLTENRFTLEEEQAILDAAQDARRGRNVTRAMHGREAIAYLKRLSARR